LTLLINFVLAILFDKKPSVGKCLCFIGMESAFINAFAYSHYHTANEDFISRNTNLAFKSTIIYNLIRYILGVSVDKGILTEQLIQTRLNTLDNLLAIYVVNAFHLPVRKTKGKCQWCWLIKEKQY
jgi:hypothetical protein